MNNLRIFLNTKRFFDCRSIGTIITADGKNVPKKPNIENRITLISPDNSISITDLKNAQSLSSRRELKLVKIQDVDSKTRRPIYKMMTNAQYHEEELSKRKEKLALSDNNALKGQKLITLSSKIADHDLLTYVKKVAKLLEKNHEVRIVVSGEEKEETKLEKISTVIERNLKSVGKIVQMRQKGNNLRLYLLPIRKNSTEGGNSELESKEHNDNKGPL